MRPARQYPEELRQWAVRLLLEPREQESGLSLNAAVRRIGRRAAMTSPTSRNRGGVIQESISVGAPERASPHG